MHYLPPILSIFRQIIIIKIIQMKKTDTFLFYLAVLFFVLKQFLIPYAGVFLTVSLLLLTFFYITAQWHLFKSLKTIYTFFTNAVLSLSTLIILFYLNHWLHSILPMVIVLILSLTLLSILILKQKAIYKYHSYRLTVSSFVNCCVLFYELFLK